MEINMEIVQLRESCRMLDSQNEMLKMEINLLKKAMAGNTQMASIKVRTGNGPWVFLCGFDTVPLSFAYGGWRLLAGIMQKQSGMEALLMNAEGETIESLPAPRCSFHPSGVRVYE